MSGSCYPLMHSHVSEEENTQKTSTNLWSFNPTKQGCLHTSLVTENEALQLVKWQKQYNTIQQHVDKVTLHLCGEINRYICYIWEFETLHVLLWNTRGRLMTNHVIDSFVLHKLTDQIWMPAHNWEFCCWPIPPWINISTRWHSHIATRVNSVLP
jgi:hypothetical protein